MAGGGWTVDLLGLEVDQLVESWREVLARRSAALVVVGYVEGEERVDAAFVEPTLQLRVQAEHEVVRHPELAQLEGGGGGGGDGGGRWWYWRQQMALPNRT